MRARALTLALVLGLAAPRLARADDPADIAHARELFKEGSSLAHKGRWDDARDRYERSLQLKRSAMTLYGLGIAQKNTGRLVFALETLRAFLAEPRTPATRPYEKPARNAVTELENQVGRLTLQVRPPGLPGLVVTVDGQEVPPVALGQPRLVDPGAHEIAATAPGRREARESATVGKGGSAAVTLVLEAEAAAPVPPVVERRPLPPPVTPPDRPRSSGPGALPFVLIGVGGLAFATGATVGVIGIVQANDAASPDSPDADSARTKMAIGDVVGGAGVIAIGVGVLLLLTQSSGSTSQPQASVRRRGVWVSSF
jgi:hypothetical protein